ncbi:starch synthase [Ruminococcus sp. YE71]|uniref:glycogen synthase n=1 Tax=unclassified Ruminococcus TaxID=2608920 RepID=UPI000882169F|nr:MULTISPECIES: glycogen/starch synthase [unclassified Ruminococcus]SDA27199.1 starch synthase [Ruminococcus sp. YE78]SFW45412.1 starch synthase [Ruminococcus sp. YE71]
MNILYTASEALPFIASGGLADVAGSLPRAINAEGHDCRVVIPYYGQIKQELKDQCTYVTNFTVPVAWRNQYCGVFTAVVNGVTYYLLDNEYYFARNGLYGFYDDAERYIFFSRAVLELLRYIDFKPNVINANDWQTALVPVYYDIFYRYQGGYEDIKTVFTIHNIQYQGRYGLEIINDLMGIPLYHTDLLEYDGDVNFMKAAIECADKITTVSPSYAWEILDPWYSYGLDRILVKKQYKLCGFLNGIDQEVYDPETDPNIPVHFSYNNRGGKKICKEKLLEEFGLAQGDEPIIGIVTRFVSHKGLDLVKYVFEDMVRLGCKFAILGSGEKIYEDFFREMQYRYPDRVGVTIGFVPPLSKRIYAGADMFLMPSQSEPCGLAQMISLRYGTIPIVRETGGLRDSIKDAGGENGNGFTFKTYNAHDMLDAVTRARVAYDDKARWSALVGHAMREDFSWKRSAELYIGLYSDIH